MNVLIASVLIAASAARGGHSDRRLDFLRQDTSNVAQADSADSAVSGVRAPVAALGSTESLRGTSLSRVPLSTVRMHGLDTTYVASASVSDSASLLPADTTFRTRRPRAIEYSDAYHTRLKIHQIGAYAMLPLFIGEYIIGQKLLTSTNRSSGLKTTHSVVAGALGVVFISNTITGGLNFLEAKKDPNGRARRTIHSVLMLASDAGMVATALSASNAKFSLAGARRHRTIAISSIALSAVGTGMMWLWRN